MLSEAKHETLVVSLRSRSPTDAGDASAAAGLARRAGGAVDHATATVAGEAALYPLLGARSRCAGADMADIRRALAAAYLGCYAGAALHDATTAVGDRAALARKVRAGSGGADATTTHAGALRATERGTPAADLTILAVRAAGVVGGPRRTRPRVTAANPVAWAGANAIRTGPAGAARLAIERGIGLALSAAAIANLAGRARWIASAGPAIDRVPAFVLD
jgi:hypothetical protein